MEGTKSVERKRRGIAFLLRERQVSSPGGFTLGGTTADLANTDTRRKSSFFRRSREEAALGRE